jgi:hypothetical protein
MLKRAFAGSFVAVVLLACGNKPTPTGLVADAGAAPVVAATDAAAAPTVDINQCPGCTTVGQGSWTFQGIFRDDKCTVPLAQLDATPCMPVPALGPTSVTFSDRVGAHAALSVANVTLSEQIDPSVPRFRKTPEGCTKANEVATRITPMNCANQRVCTDATGAAACANCRTFPNGCPDFEESRMYAAIQDTNTAAPHNSNLDKLRACCNALSTAAKGLGASPEAMTLASYAAQCIAIVNQAGPNGTAPELGAFRGYLSGANIPAVCKGL